MMPKPILFLAALTLCCCITSLNAFGKFGCNCIRTSPNAILVRAIGKIEVIPISGHCRQPEIIVTKKNGRKVCVDPEVTWINNLLRNLRKNKRASDTTSLTPTASMPN